MQRVGFPQASFLFTITRNLKTNQLYGDYVRETGLLNNMAITI